MARYDLNALEKRRSETVERLEQIPERNGGTAGTDPGQAQRPRFLVCFLRFLFPPKLRFFPFPDCFAQNAAHNRGGLFAADETENERTGGRSRKGGTLHPDRRRAG